MLTPAEEAEERYRQRIRSARMLADVAPARSLRMAFELVDFATKLNRVVP